MASVQEGRRDQITIMLDLLSNINEPRKLTHILYSSNMSYSQLVKYMQSLKGYGFVKEQKIPFRSYLITGEGQAFVDLMQKNNLD